MKNLFYYIIWIFYHSKYTLLKLNSSIFSYVYKSTLGIYCGIEKALQFIIQKLEIIHILINLQELKV